MDHFVYRDGTLHAEDVAIPDLAAAVGTPFYCYATATLVRHYEVFSGSFADLDHLVAYSIKANSNQAVIATLARLGAGADIVSEGELRRARAAGVPADRIVFSGVGKTRDEMALALNEGVLQFNIESEAELDALNAVAAQLGRRAPIAARINPDVDAGTHDKISTGRKADKFGIPWAQAQAIYGRAASLPHIVVAGVDVHIGSQLTDLAPFRRAFQRVADLVRRLRADGHDIRNIDLGGGLGIPYGADPDPPAPTDYARAVVDEVGHIDCRLVLEPGRLLVGNAGLLVAQVVYVKQTEGRTFVILDAAMNDLIRPAMYDAWHEITPVTEPAPDAPRQPVDVVGPVCESADRFATDRPLPALSPGDLVAFRSAGAYGAVMASTYNSRLLVPEVMVNGDQFAVVRPRGHYQDLIAQDPLPDWINPADIPSADGRRAQTKEAN